MHAHSNPESRRPLTVALAITAIVFIAEIAGGLLTGSLALLADAGHMLSDVMALALSLGAMWIAARPHTSARTYGFHRAEVLAALANAMLLIGIVIYVAIEAIKRFGSPSPIDAVPMMVIAAIGLVANIVSAYLLSDGYEGNLNQRGAYLHVLGDALGSVGALGAGAIILFTGWLLADPIASLLIGIIILFSAARLLRDTLNVLLESTPQGIDTEMVRTALREVAGIEDVHDLHIWSVTSGFVALSAHARVHEGVPIVSVLREATEMLHERFEIRHATIQPETESLHTALEAEGVSCCLDDYDEEHASPHR
jgi:cobalt-zinc-cadmium efflux system protein